MNRTRASQLIRLPVFGRDDHPSTPRLSRAAGCRANRAMRARSCTIKRLRERWLRYARWRASTAALMHRFGVLPAWRDLVLPWQPVPLSAGLRSLAQTSDRSHFAAPRRVGTPWAVSQRAIASEERIGRADRLAGCPMETRNPERSEHKMASILRLRTLMIAAGYEDGNDATSRRHDPLFKMATERRPSEPDLCSQPTISRMENAPDVRALLRIAGALVGPYTGSFTNATKRIVVNVADRLAPAAPMTYPTPATASRTCACLTRTTTTAFSRSGCSTTRAGRSRP